MALEEDGGTQVGTQHIAATYYSYDIHGNVSQLAQDYKKVPSMATANRFKIMEYDYDLISGKVNKVSYQKGKADAFYHQYSYDAENRLTDVYTSRDELVWERDASYQYYDHGPLKRMELGQLKVQGVDYAYTLQGWLKGVNSTSLLPSKDLGNDGVAGLITTARDILGFALHYYDENSVLDYKAIGGTSAFARPNNASFQSLYNGNIGGMSVNNGGLQKGAAATTNALPLFYNYGYDQLNRLVSMQAYKGFDDAGNVWTPVSINDYKETITYDPNGNIEEYNRNGAPEIGRATVMDQLHYNYKPTTNQLVQVTDEVAGGNYSEDIDNQGDADNYKYDKIGNLTKDGNDMTITWTVYGKIDNITKGTMLIEYLYDASGNRISKKVSGNTTTYVRDASGNVMSVYEEQGSAEVEQTELHLYGSSRFGYTGKLSVATTTTTLASTYGILTTSTFTRNEKIFELSNHVGNVMATVGDRKLAHTTNSTSVDYYEADVLSASDYAPFGMGLVGRSYDAGKYRYGFNGKEKDNEVKGEGNQQDYGMRIYDPRLGRFLSVDPLCEDYPELSSYQFASNSPIDGIDQDGEEFQFYNIRYVRENGKTKLQKGDFMKVLERTLTVTVTVKTTVYFKGIPLSNEVDIPVGLNYSDLGLSPTVVASNGVWRVLPHGINQNDLPEFDDPIWETFETPDEFETRIRENVNKVIRTANALDGIYDVGRTLKNGLESRKLGIRQHDSRDNYVNSTKGWKRGDPINNLTSSGKTPSWSTIRSRHWKYRALNSAAGEFNAQNLKRMRNGKAPKLFDKGTGKTESVELHHPKGRVDGNLFTFEKLLPSQHAAVDPNRKIKK